MSMVGMMLMLVTFSSSASAPSTDVLPADSARVWVQRAAEAMGGEATLRALKSVRLEGYGHEFVLDAFVQKEGPKPVQYDRFSELRDLEQGRLRKTVTNWLASEPDGRTFTYLIDKTAVAMSITMQGQERMFPGQVGHLEEGQETLALAPERVLLSALDAADLSSAPGLSIDGVPHRGVVFSWNDHAVYVYLNQYTHLPTVVEVHGARAHDFSWQMWGDMVQRTAYYSWAQEANGLRYPHQWDISRNGMPYQSRLLTSLSFDIEAPADSFAISDEARTMFEAQRDAPIAVATERRPIQEVALGIFSAAASFKVLMVEQEDGIVIIDAPRHVAYSENIIEEARQRFPGQPIKAVVVAAEAWTQYGGIRAYVAEGIPVYGIDNGQDIINRLAMAPFATNPDAQARAPKPLRYEAVSGKTRIGSGKNSVELYPVRGAIGDRALMVYFPEHHLLYGSSLLVPARFSPTHASQRTAELVAAVEREKLAVDNVFSMFFPQTTWAEFAASAK